jgi:NAD(P)-dependent dehydrogenase (short-subunit alcohol dehydrogenase family)
MNYFYAYSYCVPPCEINVYVTTTYIVKVVIVTGASSGMGLATAQSLVEAGSKVFGVDLSSAPQSNVLRQAEANFQFLQIDLTSDGAARCVVQSCIEAFGERIDALLNIAGIMDNVSSVDTLTNNNWERIIAVNLTAPVYLMREVIPHMRKQGSGSIVNVSSKSGTSGAVAGVAYVSSKHGLVRPHSLPRRAAILFIS